MVGLCPTTEANLGDGLFPLKEWLDAGGEIGIGSDSHISVSPVEELRWLEYGQRLLTRHRNISASAAQPSTGAVLFAAALPGGARASRMPVGSFVGGDASLPSVGNRADLLVLDERSPLLAGRDQAASARYLDLRRQLESGPARHGQRRLGRARFPASRRGADRRALSRRHCAAAGLSGSSRQLAMRRSARR